MWQEPFFQNGQVNEDFAPKAGEVELIDIMVVEATLAWQGGQEWGQLLIILGFQIHIYSDSLLRGVWLANTHVSMSKKSKGGLESQPP